MDKTKIIVKNTLIALKQKDLDATPNNYFKEFIEQAKKANFEEFEELNHTKELKKFISSLEDILAPSLDQTIQTDLNNLAKKLINEPEKLLSRKTITKIKTITKNRIKNDKKVIKTTTNNLLNLTLKMDHYYKENLKENNSSNKNIINIKDELLDINIEEVSHQSISDLQDKLVNITLKLEDNINKNNQELLNNQAQFNKLQNTIESLQNELKITKSQRDKDFLTDVLNRRSFEEELIRTENRFQSLDNNYAIMFCDIDHFKKINDNYGHDCGDAVLRTFAAILKNLTREDDIVARYGGEEFIVLINYEKQNEILHYARRIKNLVKKSDFNYKNNSINVKFSAGLTFRESHENYLDAIKKADELLYKAKNEGRNKILFEDGNIL